MSQYMLSVHNIEGEPMPEADVMQQMFADVGAFNDEIQATGAWVFGCGLHPADTATVVLAKDGEVLITDGPFAETKEHLGGFWIIDVADLDAALALAGKASAACRGTVEVRPLQPE